MFHLHNHLRNTGGTLLMTAQSAPTRWNIALPDLASRMQATTITQIDNPDDALLSALIMKLFADRQIMPKPALVQYLTPRIERSVAAAADIVARLDEAALANGRKINQALAAELLDN
jgi:chromosomal replication initiation ATPase DnaA